MGQAPSHDPNNATFAADLRNSYDRLLASGLENASFIFYHAFLVKGGVSVRDVLGKRRDAQSLFLAILTHIIPECLEGDMKQAIGNLQEMAKDTALQPHHFRHLKDSLLMTFLAVLGAKAFPAHMEDQWARALDLFVQALMKAYGASATEPEPQPTQPTPRNNAASPTHNLDSFFGFDEKSSEGEEEVRVLDLPEHAQSFRAIDFDTKPLNPENMIDTIDYLLYQDKISMFANELSGFLCVEPERDAQPLLDIAAQPANFERFLFTFCLPDLGQTSGSDKTKPHQAPTTPRISGDKHVTYGTVVTIRHLYTEKWLCVQKHLSANYSRNSYKVQLLPADQLDTACSKFKVLPRYRIRKHGEKVRIGDRVLLVPEGTSKEQVRYIHASHHKWGGKTNLMEVNCAAQSTAWTVLLYDRLQAAGEAAAAAAATDSSIRAGEVVTFIHKEVDGFLTADATDIVEHFPADPLEQMENRPFSGGQSEHDLTRLKTKASFRHEGSNVVHAAEVPLHTLCHQMFLILSNGLMSDATQESPLYFMQPQMRTSSMNPADLETSSNSLWIIEKPMPMFGGPLAPGNPYRLKHFASSKYLTLEPGPGGSYRPAVTYAITSDTFFVFHPLDQATRIVNSTTSFMRIQHQRTGYWLQCSTANVDPNHQTGERAARAQYTHNCRVLPLQITPQIPDGDVFAIVTPQGCSKAAAGTADPRDAPDFALKFVLHHLHILQEFTQAFYYHQHPYNSVQMRQIIKNAKTSLSALVLFCTEGDEMDPLKRSGVPQPKKQKVIIDQGVPKVVLEMLKSPFFVTKDGPHDEPMLPIKDVNLPEHQHLYSVCVLCYRLMKQMIIGSPSFALELCSAIPFMMKQLGYRFHVADTLSQMFLDNSMLIEHVNQTMIRQWIEHAKSQKNQLRYAKFLTKICLCNGVNIPRIQELVAQSVTQEAPELLVPIKYVEAVEGEEAHVAVQLTADAAAGEKKTKKAPELVPMEPKLTAKLSFITREASSLNDRENSGTLTSGPSKGLLKTVNSVRGMMSWRRKATASSSLRKSKSSVAELKKGEWVNLSAFCKEIGPALTNNLDATLRLYSEVSYQNDVVQAIVRPRVPWKLVLQVLGIGSTHKDLPDKFVHCFYQLCTRLHLDKRGPMQTALTKIVVWSQVDPHGYPSLDAWFQKRTSNIDEGIASLKAASLVFLSQNPVQIADQGDRNNLIQTNLEMWHVFLQQSQCTFAEVKELLQYLLPLLDYRTDRKNAGGTGGWERFSSDPANLNIMACKGKACDILHAILDSMVESAVHGALGLLKSLLPAPPQHPKTITSCLLEYLETYVTAHERAAGLIDIPYLLGILLDLAQSPDDSLTANLFRLIFRLFSFRSDVNRYLQEALILFNAECLAICRRLCDVSIAIKAVFDHISQAPSDDQINDLLTHLTVLNDGMEECRGTDLYPAKQDILSALGIFQYLVLVVRVGSTSASAKMDLLTKAYTLMRQLCVDHPRNKAILWNHLEEFVPHITFDVECDACVREIFANSPDLAQQLQLLPIADSLVDAFTLLIAQEYTLKPESTVKNLSFLEQIVVVNSVPLPRMQSMVMTSLLKHNSDFIMMLPDPCPSMCDELLQCVSGGVQLIGQCTWGKNSTTESMVQNLFPLDGVLTVISETDDPIHVRYRLPYVIMLTEVWFVTEENESGDGVQENEYKWMVNETWWMTVETFVRILTEFRDMAPTSPDFADYQTFVFKGILPCFTSYLAFFWDGDVANELPTQVTSVTVSFGSITAEYVIKEIHHEHWRTDDLEALRKLFEVLLKNNVTCDGQVELANSMLGLRLTRQMSEQLSPASEEPCPKDEIEALKRPVGDLWDKSPVDDLPAFTALMTQELERSGAGEDILRAILDRLKNNANIADATRIGLLVFLTQYIQQCSDDEDALYERQCAMGRIGCLFVVTHLFESHSEASFYAVELGQAVLHGGNTFLQDMLLTNFQSRDEGFFIKISEEFAAAIDLLREQEREKAFLRDTSVSLATRTRLAAERATTSGKAKEKMLTYVTSILRVLQLLCEGHHLQMQNYVRNQNDNLYSFNMVTEVVTFLRAVVSSKPDDSLVEVATQALNTLTEVCQGPCVENQRTLVAANICSDASILLEQPYTDCDPMRVHVLHGATVLTLLSLLEGCNDKSLPTLMVNTISLDSACKILEAMWLKVQSNVENNIDLNTEDEEMLDKSFNIYILLYVLLTWTKNAVLERLIKEVPGEPYFLSMLGVIEIARDDGLEKVYFRKPSACNMMTYEARQALLSKVNRDSPASKVSDFYEQATEVIFELEFYQEAKKYLDRNLPVWDTTNKRFTILAKVLRQCRQHLVESLPQSGVQKLEDATLVVALVLNGAILLSAAQERGCMWMYCAELLVCWQAALSSALTILAFLYDLPILAHRQRLQQRGVGKMERFHKPETESIFGAGVEWRALFRIPIAVKFHYVWYILLVTTSLLGLLISPLFCCFHVLGMCRRSAVLQSVIQSITANGRSLVLTAVLGMAVIYLFSVIAYLQFPEDFVDDEGEVVCRNLAQCFLYVLMHGLRQGGGVGDLLHKSKLDDPKYHQRMIFDFVFFMVVVVILLNIIFGIIIDTFAELRDQRQKVEEDTRRRCFICGVDSDTFDRHIRGGFEHHIQKSHNMWHYLYFIHHLQRKPQDEFTGQESYVQAKIMAKDMTFFPLGKSMDLSAAAVPEFVMENQKAPNPADSEMVKKLEQLETNVTRIEQSVTALIETLKNGLPSKAPPSANGSTSPRGLGSPRMSMVPGRAASSHNLSSPRSMSPRRHTPRT